MRDLAPIIDVIQQLCGNRLWFGVRFRCPSNGRQQTAIALKDVIAGFSKQGSRLTLKHHADSLYFG
jgi:hypothetical protein